MAGSAVEWLAARSARRVAPEGAALGRRDRAWPPAALRHLACVSLIPGPACDLASNGGRAGMDRLRAVFVRNMYTLFW